MTDDGSTSLDDSFDLIRILEGGSRRKKELGFPLKMHTRPLSEHAAQLARKDRPLLPLLLNHTRGYALSMGGTLPGGSPVKVSMLIRTRTSLPHAWSGRCGDL